MPSRDVDAATRLAEASWRRDYNMKMMVIQPTKEVNVGSILHFELILGFGLILNKVFKCNMQHYILKSNEVIWFFKKRYV